VLLLFGARRIPEIARSLGSGAREFREGISGAEPPEEKGEEPAEHKGTDRST
jgi:sec-independent protein translocase protein TatA